VMGNLVTEEDRDAVARLWRWAGRRSIRFDGRPPFEVQPTKGELYIAK